MNTDSTTLSQIQSLLGTSAGANGTPTLLNTDALIKALMPITIIATIVSILIALLYIFSVVQRIRVDRAVLESRDLLREMNARQKAAEAIEEIPSAPANQ